MGKRGRHGPPSPCERALKMRSAAARLRSLISANDLLKGKLAMDIPDNGPGEILWSSIAKFELDLDKIKQSSCGPVGPATCHEGVREAPVCRDESRCAECQHLPKGCHSEGGQVRAKLSLICESDPAKQVGIEPAAPTPARRAPCCSSFAIRSRYARVAVSRSNQHVTKSSVWIHPVRP